LINQLAGVKFAGICFLSNFRIHRPQFYPHVDQIVDRDRDPVDTLQQLLQISLEDGGERDSTRAGPSRFPWITDPEEIHWGASLTDVLIVFREYVCFRSSLFMAAH
jgi:hypothetical protein